MKPYLVLLLAACHSEVAGPGPGPDGGTFPGDDVECPSLVMPGTPADLYVDASGSGAELGTKEAPFRTVGKAVANARSNAIIWVAAGHYQDNVVVPDENLVIHGGFTAGFSGRSDACATVVEAASVALPVFWASSFARNFMIDGLSIRNGAHGLLVDGDATLQATFTIKSSVFTGNGQIDSPGGGASVEGASVVVSHSVFRDNRASKGAALAIDGDVAIMIEGSLFERNIGHADHGGAVYVGPRTGTIEHNTFRSNEIGKDVGYGWGGAVIVYKGSAFPAHVDLAYNVFTDNLASVGGAVFIDDGATATMSHDLLYANRSIRENGVVRGAALYVDGASPGIGSVLVADHLTVVDNVYDETGARGNITQGGAVYLETSSKATFTNSILWHNGDDALIGDPSTEIAVSYSVAPGECVGVARCTIGAGVFEPDDVLFVDEAERDYHEKSTAGHFHGGAFQADAVTSPTIDRADPTDGFANEPASNGNRANLGCYGNTPEASKSP